MVNTVKIPPVVPNQRTTILSAPVGSSLGSSILVGHQRVPTSSASFRHPFGYHLSQSHSTVSIYDMSILLPVSKKLVHDYKLDLNNLIDMCEMNQQLTEQMAKHELAHCWRLLAGLLTIQSSLPDDHFWFQIPMAQGKMLHIKRKMEQFCIFNSSFRLN